MRDRLVPALGDFGAERTTPATFANALRNGERTAVAATGRPNATLEGMLEPNQLQMLQGVAQQLGRRANAEELGRAVGSPTAQNLVSQNLLRQILGPLGLPEGWAEGAVGQGVGRLPQWLLQTAEPRVLNRLSEALLNPQDAANLLMLAAPGRNALADVLTQTGRVALPVQVGGMFPQTALAFDAENPRGTARTVVASPN